MTKCCPKAWLEKSSWNSYSSMVVTIHPLHKRQCQKWHRKPTRHPTWFQNSSQLVLCNHMTLMKLEELILYHQLLALLLWFWNLGDVIHRRFATIFLEHVLLLKKMCVCVCVCVCVRQRQRQRQRRGVLRSWRDWAELTSFGGMQHSEQSYILHCTPHPTEWRCHGPEPTHFDVQTKICKTSFFKESSIRRS